MPMRRKQKILNPAAHGLTKAEDEVYKIVVERQKVGKTTTSGRQEQVLHLQGLNGFVGKGFN